jgi:hypothetical protein
MLFVLWKSFKNVIFYENHFIGERKEEVVHLGRDFGKSFYGHSKPKKEI